MTQSVLINNTYMVKQSNTELIRKALKKFGTATRTEISRETNLSIATCGNILKDLLDSGEVFEDEFDNRRGGRPAQKYTYNKDFSLALCMTLHVDEDNTILHYVVTNLSREILEDKHHSYKKISMNDIDELVGSKIKEYPSIKAFGVGIPGISDKTGKVLYNDIDDLNGLELAKILHEKYDIEVNIASSPNLTAYGYYKNHPEYKDKALVGILAPRDNPFGAGVVINGRIYKGDMNVAGEISYMKFNADRNSREHFVENMTTALSAIITVMAPSVILLTGGMFNEETFNAVCENCRKLLPAEFIPEFVYEADTEADYVNGVINMAIDSMSYGVRLMSY